MAEAVRATRRIEEDFGPKDDDANQGFYEAKAGDEILISRRKTFWDSAIPIDVDDPTTLRDPRSP